MKTATKIELGIIAFVTIASFMFQLDLRSSLVPTTNANATALSGIIESKTIQLNDFNALEYDMRFDIKAPIKLTYKSGEPSVTFTADKSLLDQLDASVNNNILFLKSSSVGKVGYLTVVDNKETRGIIKVEITGPNELKQIRSDQHCKIEFLDPIVSSSMVIDMDKHSSIDINLTTDSLMVQAGSHSEIILRGTANNTNLIGGSLSSLIGNEFESKHLHLDVRNSFNGTMKVTESVKGILTGHSTMTVSGNPKRAIVKERRNSEFIIVEGE